MSEAVFNSLYKKLNPEQKKAVDAIEGPVMVIAGPGTGKTSILTLRIANILQKTDTSPDSILALTFTESGVYSMRKKLVEIIGAAAYRVGIFTFHGFANYLIHRYQESFPRIVGGRPATAADQVRLLEEIFLHPNKSAKGGFARARRHFKRIRPFGDIFYYVPKALRAIRELKRENISPDAFTRHLAKEVRELRRAPGRLHRSGRFRGELTASHRERLRKIEKSKELAEVYRQYEAELMRERLFDFEDMILEVNRAFEKDKDLLLTLEEQYQYILADEHQDANNAQSKMLELLASFDDSPNLFIVGDEKQAIYRFQGASVANFLHFRTHYQSARLITLTKNYRSTGYMLDAAHSLMEKGAVPDGLPRETLRPRLAGRVAGAPGNIRFLEFVKADNEITYIIEDIERRLTEGVSPREIAVFVRDNEDVLPLLEALEKTAIPFSVLSHEDILKDEELGKLLLILRAVSQPGSEKLFAEMLQLDFLGVPPVALYTLLQFCREKRVSIFEVLSRERWRRQAKIPKDARMLSVFSDFSRLARLAKNTGAGEAVETIARESGFVRHLLSRRGSLRALEKLDALFAHLKELSAYRRAFTLPQFLEILERLQKHGLRLSGKGIRPEFYDSMSVMTAHRGKGLEFDYVYMVGVVDGKWGGRRPRSDFYLPVASVGRMGAPENENEDERRLFFVALTRARNEVVLTMAREGAGGKPRLPSQFLEDMDAACFVREQSRALEEKLSLRAPLYLKPRINAGPSVTLREYLQKVFLEQGLTVTALNNYLSCPWEYFFKNLVRLPRLPEAYLSYGTAMHAALHAFFDAYKENKRAGKKELLRLFEREMERSPLPLRDFERYREKGRKALAGYFDAHAKTFSPDARNEFEITGVFLPLDVGLSFPSAAAEESRTDSSKKLYSRFRLPAQAGGNDKKSMLLLRGVIDKLERNSDGSVTVVDYKTGKPKSRAQILGETSGSDGNLKRQLDFYKLLLQGLALSREKGQTFHMTSGVIDFVEPDSKGRYHREAFEITQKDVAALTEEIQRVGQEIYALSFWDRRCERRGCEFCRLRQTLSTKKEER